MSDLIEVAAGPIKEKIAGTEYVFEELSLYEKAALLIAERDKRRQQKIENLKLAGVPGEQIYVELENFDEEAAKKFGDAKWIEFINTMPGQLVAFKASLARNYPDRADELSKQIKWPNELRLKIAAHICGLTITRPEPPPPDEQKGKPLVYDQAGDESEGSQENPPTDRCSNMGPE
jgi:hypothetical protein